ncbi:MAG: hypothetical protein RIR18_307 [Pseudomonadota bacterium]|jgi:chromosome segregation ATPase
MVLVVVFFGQVMGQTNEVIELKEARTALQFSASRINDLEARLVKAKEQVNSLADSLAVANADMRQNREAYEKLRIQLEGLGLAALDASNAELQQRLLSALSDLRILNQQKQALSAALVSLSESSMLLAKQAVDIDPALRKQVEESLSVADKQLASLKAENTVVADVDLQSAKVVSLKSDLNVAVLNVGSRHGVHPGMPFSIFRQDKPIAHALVVDVRNGICGVVVQELISSDEPVKVGDTGKVEAMKG